MGVVSGVCGSMCVGEKWTRIFKVLLYAAPNYSKFIQCLGTTQYLKVHCLLHWLLHWWLKNKLQYFMRCELQYVLKDNDAIVSLLIWYKNFNVHANGSLRKDIAGANAFCYQLPLAGGTILWGSYAFFKQLHWKLQGHFTGLNVRPYTGLTIIRVIE